MRLKEEILGLIEKDKEFRYALMGLLGFRELLERFSKLEERQLELERRQQKLEERQQRLEERFAKLEERFAGLEEEHRETRRLLQVIAHRFGILTESSFREAMKYVVKEVFREGEVSKWVYSDKEGLVYGHPSVIEVDVLVRDNEHVLIEIKSRVSKGDISELYRIGKLYEKVENVKPKLAIIGGFIDPQAQYLASGLGVNVIPAVKNA